MKLGCNQTLQIVNKTIFSANKIIVASLACAILDVWKTRLFQKEVKGMFFKYHILTLTSEGQGLILKLPSSTKKKKSVKNYNSNPPHLFIKLRSKINQTKNK